MSLFKASSSEIVTHTDQLLRYFSTAEKPKSDWLIGCEHEKFPFRLSSLAPVSYAEDQGLHEFMLGMEDFGWKPIFENENIIGLTRGLATITFEPGGQVELSGAPLHTLHEVSTEIDQHLTEACEIGDRLGIGFLGMGFHPTATRNEISIVPKSRYVLQSKTMPKYGGMALDMMKRTCTVQVNLDFSDEADMVKKFRVGLALQPVATALFAASPFVESIPSGFNCYRMNVWTDTDPVRCGNIPFVFEPGFGYERYVNYALDVPMQFIYRGGKHIDCNRQSFRDFLRGGLSSIPGELPTLSDWGYHLTTLFPDVRLKKVLEMRGADSGPAEMLLALPSLWTGLLYDSTALDNAETLINEWSADDRNRLHSDVPRLGLNAEIRGQKVSAIAETIIGFAKQGLRRRANRLHGGADEGRYLDVLLGITDSNQNLSDQLLMQYEHFANYSIKSVFDTCRLRPPPIQTTK